MLLLLYFSRRRDVFISFISFISFLSSEDILRGMARVVHFLRRDGWFGEANKKGFLYNEYGRPSLLPSQGVYIFGRGRRV